MQTITISRTIKTKSFLSSGPFHTQWKRTRVESCWVSVRITLSVALFCILNVKAGWRKKEKREKLKKKRREKKILNRTKIGLFSHVIVIITTANVRLTNERHLSIANRTIIPFQCLLLHVFHSFHVTVFNYRFFFSLTLTSLQSVNKLISFVSSIISAASHSS